MRDSVVGQPLRVVILQHSVLHYRLPFYDAIAAMPNMELEVYAGYVKGRESSPAWFRKIPETLSIARGFDWQPSVATLDISNVDVLVLSGSVHTISNLPLALRARAKGVTVLWWGQYHGARSTSRSKWLRRILYRLGSGVILYTDAEARAYTTDGGTLPVWALNNGIDTRDIVLLRSDEAPADRPRRLLFIGRLTEKARFDLLLQALTYPEARGIELSAVGDADDTVRSRASALGVADRVHWHGPLFSEAEIAPIANAARMFVYPGDSGLSIIHAMAYGLPVLVHGEKNRHMPEIAAFSEGATGETFRRDEPSDLARKMAWMIDNTELLANYSAAACERVANEFNTEKMAIKFAKGVVLAFELARQGKSR